MAWTGEQPSSGPARPAATIELLPGDETQDPVTRLAEAFLLGYRTHSARGYLTDLRTWPGWCQQLGVHPFDVRRHHVPRGLLHHRPQPERTGQADAADEDSARSGALTALLAYDGLRIDEVLNANIVVYRYQHRHRVPRVIRKGGKVSTGPREARFQFPSSTPTTSVGPSRLAVEAQAAVARHSALQ